MTNPSGVTNSDWVEPTTTAGRILLSQEVGNYLLRVMAKVCGSSGITFYLNGGNLIGSFRSNGWIPWDDDVDVLMWRHDYEALRDLRHKEFPRDVDLTDMLLESRHVTALPRLRYLPSRLRFEDRLAIAPWERQKLALDICILDRAPTSPILEKAWLLSTKLMQRSIAIRATRISRILRSRETGKTKATAICLLSFSRLAPLDIQKQVLTSWSGAFRNSASRRIFILNHSRAFRDIPVDEAWFENPELVEFAGGRYKAPQVVPFLSALYGASFGTPPPVHLQTPHDFDQVCARMPPSEED